MNNPAHGLTPHHMSQRLTAIIAFLFATLLLSGCASIPKEKELQLPNELPNRWAADVAADDLPITTSLLDLINEKHLKSLVQEALDNNPNLKTTALRLKASGYLLGETRSRLLPQVNAEFSAGRSNENIDVETGEQTTANSYQPSLGVSWEVDMWGRLAGEHAASRFAVLAEEYEYLYAQDALAARVIQAWIQEVAVRRSLDILEQRVEVLRRVENILIERYKNGIGNLDELSTARSRTEMARADLSEQKATSLQVIRTLEVLLGRYPRGELLSAKHLPVVTSPPVGVPATVLLKRPDIRAALARVESARYLSGSADRARLPDLRLSGQLFKKAARLDAFGGTTTIWGILGSLFQPLFDGGRLRDQARARLSEADASLMELHEIVLQALKEVEDAFDLDHHLAAQVYVLKIAVHESEKSSRYYEERYRQGLDTILSLLFVQEQEMSVKIRLNEAVARRLSNRIDLALALGVGVSGEPAQITGVSEQ